MSDVKDTLQQRGSIYGDYKQGVLDRAQIMDILKDTYRKNNGNREMSRLYEGYLWDIVNKLCRLSVTPGHIDSWHDIQGYAQLTENALRKDNEA